MKRISGVLIILFLIGLIITAGCTQGTSSIVPVNSDDDLYLQSLEDCISTSQPIPQPSSAQFSQEQMAMAELKIRSTTYYNRVTPLKVSSKLEYSKTSFLQMLKEEEAIADFELSHSSDEQLRFAGYPSSMTAVQKQEYTDAALHNQNIGLFLIKTFDSNVCTAATGKYTNITLMCDALSKMTK